MARPLIIRLLWPWLDRAVRDRQLQMEQQITDLRAELKRATQDRDFFDYKEQQ